MIAASGDHIPAVVAAVAIVFAVAARYRRWRRARRVGPAPAPRVTRRRPSFGEPLARLLGDAGLVAGREIHTRTRTRMFRISTLLVIVAIALGVALPTLIHHGRTVEKVGLADVPAALAAATVTTGAHLNITVQLVREPSIAKGRADLRAGRIGMLVEASTAVVTNKAIQTNDTSSGAQLARQVAVQLGITKALSAAHLSATQSAALAHAKALPLRSLTRGPHSTTQTVSLIGLPLLLFMFIQYNTWTMIGVIEEKASRVVEVLLATVRPIELLAGKVLGIGVVAFSQGGLVVATALIVGAATGSSLTKGSTLLFVLAVLTWLVLGYAFYSWVYAAAGSLAERQDQVQSLALPISVPILLGYVVALTAQASGSASPLVTVLAYLPPTAPFAMPALVAVGAATWWGFLAAAALSVAATFAVAHLAATIYSRAVLRTGRRVHLREVLRSRSA